MKNTTKAPFFAKFLENQIQNENEVIGGGKGNGKTNPNRDTLYTTKYPSDSEDTGSQG